MKIMQRLSGSFSAAAFVALAATFVPFGMGVSVSSSAVAAVLPDFTDLVDKVGPAVVNIRTTERAKGMQPGQGAPGSEDEEMQEFFRRFLVNHRVLSLPAASARSLRRAVVKVDLEMISNKHRVVSVRVSLFQPTVMC